MRWIVLEHGELILLDLEAPPASALEVLDFYDHVGLLVKKGHLEVYDVWHTFYEWAQPVYVDLRPLIEDEESPFSEHYLDLKRLMRRMDELQIGRMHKKQAQSLRALDAGANFGSLPVRIRSRAADL